MKVRLISYTQPTQEMVDNGMSEDLGELVAFCARVSNPNNQMNHETSEKLVKYLIKNKHWSPFEMVNICLEIETTRDIARQILRHRSFSFQEFSQRYAVANGFEIRETRLQDIKNRQNSFETNDIVLVNWWRTEQERLLEYVQAIYNEALQKGIAKEVARAILPEGLTKSCMYMNGTLRSWIHYIQLREEEGTQKEHIKIAQECARAINEIFPLEVARS